MATNTKGAYSNLRTGRTYYPNSRRPFYLSKVGYYYRRPRNAYRGYQKKGADFKLVRSVPWIIGGLIGFTDIDNKIPASAKVLAATMPVSGRIGGKIRSVGQGMCFGDVVQKNVLPLIGIKIGAGAHTVNNGGANYV